MSVTFRCEYDGGFVQEMTCCSQCCYTEDGLGPYCCSCGGGFAWFWILLIVLAGVSIIGGAIVGLYKCCQQRKFSNNKPVVQIYNRIPANPNPYSINAAPATKPANKKPAPKPKQTVTVQVIKTQNENLLV